MALPDSERQLEEARREVARLTEAMSEAALVYLRSEAGNVLSEYRKAWRDLCGHYNALVGISAALGMRNAAEIRSIEAPDFNFHSFDGDSAGRLIHTRTDLSGDMHHASRQATSDWSRALDRLIESPDADLSDLSVER